MVEYVISHRFMLYQVRHFYLKNTLKNYFTLPVNSSPVLSHWNSVINLTLLPDRYSSFMAYKLPVEDVHPLSRAFFKLEAGKFGYI